MTDIKIHTLRFTDKVWIPYYEVNGKFIAVVDEPSKEYFFETRDACIHFLIEYVRLIIALKTKDGHAKMMNDGGEHV